MKHFAPKPDLLQFKVLLAVVNVVICEGRLVKIVMSAAHGGFGSEKVPLGGGAAVFERLAESAAFRDSDMVLLGAGPRQTSCGRYRQILDQKRAPSALGMLEYAKFSRVFGHATTEATLKIQPDILICHDISEGPDVERLSRAGIAVVTIFHVDVVDIFSRLYLGGVFEPSVLTHKYRNTRSLPWPGLLKLVFENQQQVMTHGALSVVPSQGAHDLLRRCYPQASADIRTVGWGAPLAKFTLPEIEQKTSELRRLHKIPNENRILLTLSRLSPEKAQHRLLEAVKMAESEGRMPTDISVVIAGAPAFMEGKRHAKKLKRLATKLQTQVVFPGHVGGLEKAAWYHSAYLFVVNSLHESYGLTTLEAMQQGCPVVAVESFGTKDTVSKDVGLLIPPGAELVRRLWGGIELLLRPESRDWREKMSSRARETATEQTFTDASERLLKTLQELPKLS